MGTTAVLLVHGILGRPEQFNYLLPLIPKDWEVRNLTLKGHGGTPKEFGRYPVSQWKEEVHREAETLCSQYDRVFMVGHSLGTLFSIQESLKLPIEGMFLTNVPLGVRITPRLFKMCIRIFLDRVDQSDAFIVAAKNAYGISLDRNVFHYIKWVPRFLELFSEISHTGRIVSEVKVDSMAFISARDEMASPRSAKILRKKTDMEVTVLPESGHFYYSDKDKQLMQSAFLKFLGIEDK